MRARTDCDRRSGRLRGEPSAHALPQPPPFSPVCFSAPLPKAKTNAYVKVAIEVNSGYPRRE
jgi:hypothetical protein